MEPFLIGVKHDVGLTTEPLADIGWGLPNLTGVWAKTKEGCRGAICRAKDKFTVRSDGAAPAEATVLRFFHSADATFDIATDTLLIQQVTIGGLAGGESQIVKLKGTTTNSGTPLGGFIFGVIDVLNDEIEEDETDNEIRSAGCEAGAFQRRQRWRRPFASSFPPMKPLTAATH